MSWLKKADFPPAPPMNIPPKAPGAKPPMAPKGPADEKKDVLDGKGIAKAIKDLISREKAEGEDVKLLEQALEKVEKYVEVEKKEVDKEKKEDKSEKKAPPKEKEEEKED